MALRWRAAENVRLQVGPLVRYLLKNLLKNR